jgi:tetratricopeptide (TPR) repeat protein
LAPSALVFWLALGWAGRREEASADAAAVFSVRAGIGGLAVAAVAAALTARLLTAEVLLSKGYRLFMSGAPRQATGYFQKFENLNPNSYEERFFAGALHHELRDYGRAIESYERALALYPGMQGALYNLGNVALSLRQYDRAIVQYDRALALNPCLAEAANNRGNAYALLGNSVRARADFLRAVKLRPGYTEALFNLGAQAFRAGDRAQALDWLAAALKSNPDYEPARALVADIEGK